MYTELINLLRTKIKILKRKSSYLHFSKNIMSPILLNESISHMKKSRYLSIELTVVVQSKGGRNKESKKER